MLNCVKKNRIGFIRHLFSLPSKFSIDEDCQYCAKAEAGFFLSGVRDFIGLHEDIPTFVKEGLDMSGQQYFEMERRYEGWGSGQGETRFRQHDYKDIAQWLQTLPGWPQVL